MSATESSGAATPSASRLFASNGFGMFMLGIALALGGAFAAQSVSKAIVASRTTSSIRVKGSASVDLKSDFAKWGGTVTARGATLQEAYASLGTGVDRLQRFLAGRGFPATEVTTSAVHTSTVMRKTDKGNETNRIESYELRQSVQVASARVEAVRDAAREATSLIREGIDVASGQPEYMIAALDGTKVELLDKATRNAMDRARTLADGSGSSVGSLLNASQGVIQVVPLGSTSSGDMGEYDTSTIDKTMRAVVSLEYAVR